VLLPALHDLLGRVVALLPAVARLPGGQVVVHRLQLARRLALRGQVEVLRGAAAVSGLLSTRRCLAARRSASCASRAERYQQNDRAQR